MPAPEYPHDPEFPFLVLFQQRDGLVLKIAKFKDWHSAAAYAGNFGPAKIVDTTPKPRIPVDAKYLAIKAGKMSAIAIRGELGWKVIGDGQPFWFSDESFEASFSDSEITVLDPRKEES